MLQLAHEGHPGETSMTSRLRDRVWWPGMDKDTKKVVKDCEGCRLVGKPSLPEPMRRRRMPSEPWIDVAMDFLGLLPSGDYLLVIVDYFSRYKEICIMKKITSEETIKQTEPIFVRQGYPRTITLDNGREFISKEFEDYCRIKNITLNHTVPYWPQANGEVERQNSSLLKRLKISHALHRDWKVDLLQYLLMYNTTPHSTTGKTPTELLRNKTIRSKIPSLSDIETAPPVDSEFSDRDTILQYKGKVREDLRRHSKPSEIKEGDTVLMQNLLPGGKLSTTFGNTEYTVMEKTGNRVKVSDPLSGNSFLRSSAHLKKVTPIEQITQEPAEYVSEPNSQELSFHPDSAISSTPGDSAYGQIPETADFTTTNAAETAHTIPASRPLRHASKPAWQKDFVCSSDVI
ncbi:uncharacterized protein K02A2.6-like [Topomyia yanbarensis]|uniref:uncharacterized protein K02A2.6-like n=1 Tax=Topomyia yanbarensis TaxID=2498891 RepID=UPI00273A95D7|nr:uncharacterized protein K02A2.6-like [Topomyia yanbarensis]